MATDTKTTQRNRRRKRIRARVSGTATKPRISVYRSNKSMLVQAIDDVKGVTLAASRSTQWEDLSLKDSAEKIGADIGAKLTEKGVKEAVFDRGGYIYTGNVAKVAEGIRAAGIKM